MFFIKVSDNFGLSDDVDQSSHEIIQVSANGQTDDFNDKQPKQTVGLICYSINKNRYAYYAADKQAQNLQNDG